jgi:UDP-N-acetyl-D-galactosamine dehydrogenase
MKKIAIIGLGYVGLPLAVEFGKGRPVVGFDIDSRRIIELQAGDDRTLECSSEDIKGSLQLKFSDDFNDLKSCQIFIVTVPTPVDSVNHPDMSALVSASQLVGKALKKGDIVVYESTVYPGATEEVCVPELEKVSGLKFNLDFYCGYSPERINPGDKLRTLKTIKKITSGSSPEIADEIDALYRTIIEAGTWKAQSIKVAEAAKVVENCQRDLNIAFVNELSRIFAKIEIDTVEVLEAAGTKWNFLPFRPGMVGGHCIGVDPYYLTFKAQQLGYVPEVILAGRKINDSMARYAGQSIIRLMLKNGIDVTQSKIGVLGITFKDNCPDIRNSKVIDLIDELRSWSAKVVVSDPWANADEVRQTYGIELALVDEFHQVDCLIFAVRHNEFQNFSIDYLKTICRAKNPVIADLKSIFNLDDLVSSGFTVFRL